MGKLSVLKHNKVIDGYNDTSGSSSPRATSALIPAAMNVTTALLGGAALAPQAPAPFWRRRQLSLRPTSNSGYYRMNRRRKTVALTEKLTTLKEAAHKVYGLTLRKAVAKLSCMRALNSFDI